VVAGLGAVCTWDRVSGVRRWECIICIVGLEVVVSLLDQCWDRGMRGRWALSYHGVVDDNNNTELRHLQLQCLVLITASIPLLSNRRHPHLNLPTQRLNTHFPLGSCKFRHRHDCLPSAANRSFTAPTPRKGGAARGISRRMSKG